jgi:outer membrane protein assembly factor BamB
MKNKFLLVILTLIALSLTLSACAGGRLQASGWPGISADDETAYVAFNQQVYAINLTNGLQQWSYPEEINNNITFYAAPSLTEDGQVIVGGYNNILYSLDAESGLENWTFEEATDRYIGSSLVAGEMIFAPSSDNNLFALGLNGQPAWVEPFTTENSNWSKPSADSNCECIYLASMDHSVYAINPVNGQEIWRSESLGGATVGTPAISEDGKTLYIGTFNNELAAINTINGSILWRFSTEGWAWASPVVEGDVVYFGDIEGNFYAINGQTGEQVWKEQADGQIVGKPLITEDGIYFTTAGDKAGSLYALYFEGGTRWTETFEATLHSGPIAAGDLILVTTDEGGLVLYAYNADKVQQWQFSPDAEE